MVDPMLTVSMAEQQVVVDSAEMNCRVASNNSLSYGWRICIVAARLLDPALGRINSRLVRAGAQMSKAECAGCKIPHLQSWPVTLRKAGKML